MADAPNEAWMDLFGFSQASALFDWASQTSQIVVDPLEAAAPPDNAERVVQGAELKPVSKRD